MARPPRPAALIVALGVLAAAGGCAARRAEPRSVRGLEALPPVLPAMEAEVYATGARAPADPVVALAVAGLAAAGTLQGVDEALSGAAAALALDGGEALTTAQARWAAWRAGYPFLVRAVVSGRTETAGLPDAVAQGLREVVQPGDQVGLARARSGQVDRWVALVAHPLAGVPAFSRQHEVGQPLSVALPAQAEWRVVSPGGVALAGRGAVAVRLEEAGEWWLEARLPDGMLSLPVYAGMPMPPGTVLDVPGPAPGGPDEVTQQALDLLGELRATFDLPALSPDPTLRTLGHAPLEQVLLGTWQHDAAVDRLRAAGFVGPSVDQVWCRSTTVALCLEGLLHSADGRIALLDERHGLVGVAAGVDTQALTLVLTLASE
ncbi:hypothetical protein L6R53_04885 [Myxococcota bacterium]|nr:hypothetical protein [Myxococcota bacterium]